MNQPYIKLDTDRRPLHVEALVYSIRFTTTNLLDQTIVTHISYVEAKRLVEMLVKHTHPGQTLSPPMPVTAPMAHLIVGYSHDSGKRFFKASCLESASFNAQALKRAEPDRPVWLGYLTKEFVQPTPSYEWKDL